eukprot:13001208-Alexandrium_andersonii.AAC.1
MSCPRPQVFEAWGSGRPQRSADSGPTSARRLGDSERPLGSDREAASAFPFAWGCGPNLPEGQR